MAFADLLTRAIERRSAERRLFDRRQTARAAPFPERRLGPRRASDMVQPDH